MTDPKNPGAPEIRLHDSASRAKRPLRPLDPGDVRMYVCGPTVYDRAHIGNARPVVVFDVLFRLLRRVYGAEAVTYVRNITDIDDKINRRAADTRGEGESTRAAIRRITDQTTRWYHEDMAALGALPPTHEPRATEFVDAPDRPTDMIRMIAALIGRGCAYEAEGHVLFHVPSWQAYGALSRRPLDEMESGARVEVAPYKRSPLDFVLWKPSDETLPGWDSPWGRGRPGWHIECSAMARALLGTRFDIHGGGIDLQFPHHENELAQSCCANDADAMASIWMHNGYLMVEGEKMSKSLGNFFTVRDLLDRGIEGREIRFMLLSTHYRQPLDWTTEKIKEAAEILAKWDDIARIGSTGDVPKDLTKVLSDDLNTAEAISLLHGYARERRADELKTSMIFLGFGVVARAVGGNLSSVVEGLKNKREAARRNGDYAQADKIRNLLRSAGIELMDSRNGTSWEVRRDLVDSEPFHKAFKLAVERGDRDQIERVRQEAEEAGVYLRESGDTVVAWRTAPREAFIMRQLSSYLGNTP